MAEPVTRLVLISHPRHLDAARNAGPGALVVSTDWLTCRQLEREGVAVRHVDAMLGDYDPPADVLLRHGEWMIEAGGEVGLLDGMSTAKALNREVELSVLGFQRLWHALDGFCRVYAPKELVLYDLRGEYGQVGDTQKRILVQALAASHGLTVVDRLDPPDDIRHFHDVLGIGAPLRPKGAKAVLRNLLADLTDLAFRLLRPFRRKTGGVLFFLNPLMEQGLLESWPGGPAGTVLIAQRSPKSLSFLRDCLRRGATLASLPRLSLTREEVRRLEAGAADLREHWRTHPPAAPVEAARRAHVEEKILTNGRLLDFAAEAKSYRALLTRHRVARVVVGDATNTSGRLIVEAAHAAGIPADELLNGMFVHDCAYDIRCGDRCGPPKLSRLLSWGPSQEDWLRRIGSKLPTARVGYPGLDPVRRGSAALSLPPVGRGRVLLLPGTSSIYNFRMLRGTTYSNIVDVTRMLRRLGYQEIRLKVHPAFGPAAWAALDREFDLGLEIVTGGSVPQQMVWADLVIGPADSGSLVETLAAGKPYYALVPQPNSVDPAVMGPVPLYADAEALAAALAAGEVPDRDAILDHMCDFSRIPNASAAVWRVLNQ